MYFESKPYPLLGLFALGALLFQACYPSGNSNGQTVFVANAGNSKFAAYWYTGEAEVNTYDITMNRYGEERIGEAVTVFVTEDFSASKQVKLDNPHDNGKDKVPIMKMNHIRRFVTGIYDYSMMMSVFTPVDLKVHSQTLKTTTTSQDWCGHTFTQLNLDGEKYKVNGFSYFESEGDEKFNLKSAMLEDEFWNRLRIAPESISEGTLEVVPSTFYTRLSHKNLEPKQARIRFEKQETTTQLFLEYLHIDRTVSIEFESNFPHRILSWNEQMDGQTISSGKLKATMNSAYWRQHGNQHDFLRDSLMLQ